MKHVSVLTIAVLALAAGLPQAAAKGGADLELPADRRPSRKVAGRPVLIRAARILPVSGPSIERGSLLVVDGKIKAIGAELEAPKGAMIIEAEGHVVIPGVIDCHSHMAIEGGVNEMSEKLSPEVRIGDSVNPKDLTIYRALAGGVTSALLLHGSANPIGGQSVVVKMRFGESAPGMVFKEAPRGIKFALGENPKRRGGFPKTRQGIMATMRRAFTMARDYRASWRAFEAARARGEPRVPPRRDLRLETYADVLDGKIKVHCHCYRSDEIVALIEVAEEFGFKISTFQHVLEGYKVAERIARHGAGGSTFSDWWAYKIEAFEAIPHNAAVMTRAGVLTSINSDSGELVRHLPLEAAKSMRYGGLTADQCLALVTLNPARQLGIDRWVGSLEVGKHADLSIWNGHPLSVFSRAVLTMVDGEILFDRPASSRRARFSPPKPRGKLRIKRQKEGRYLLKGARVHPVNRAPFTGDVLLEGGRIAAMGPKLETPEGARLIKAKGLFVSPGLIDAGTSLGLEEIGSAEETSDTREAGLYQPDLVARDGLNPHSELIPVTRLGGTTLAVSLPNGGVLSGQASLIRLRGDFASELVVEARLGLCLNFPRGPDKGPNKKLAALSSFLEEARSYLARRAATPATTSIDLRFEALAPYLKGERPVLVPARRAKDMIECVEWARSQKLKLILTGGDEAWRIADYLAEENIPVVVGPVLRVPRGDTTPHDALYRNPARLQEAGVRFAIQSSNSSPGGSANARILPFEAGVAAAYGLTPDQALRSVTLSAAEILGIDADYGSLEKGKSATLIVTTGHPLEPSSQVIGMFIEGQPVSLESKQTRLYRRFAGLKKAKKKAPRAKQK